MQNTNDETNENPHRIRRATLENLCEFTRDVFDYPIWASNVTPTAADLNAFRRDGQWYNDIGGKMTAASLGSCYVDAYELATERSGLTYVQGFIVRPEVAPLLIARAWCVDGWGAVVETTQAPRAGDRYFGIQFSVGDLVRLQGLYGRYEWYEGFALASVVLPPRA